MRTIFRCVLTVTTIALFPLSAAAQMKWTDNAVIAVDVGAQVGSHSLDTTKEFTLYEEPGNVKASQKTGGGGFFDIGAGCKVWRNLVVGLTYSHSSSKDDAAVTALVPDPAVTDRPRNVTGTFANAKYSENAIHFTGTWMVPVTDKIEVGVLLGPSVFFLKQDVPSAITVNEPAATLATLDATAFKKTAAGFHTGVDVTYLVTKKVGAGLLARYTWGSADLKDAGDSLTAGGFQIGVGLRYRLR